MLIHLHKLIINGTISDSIGKNIYIFISILISSDKNRNSPLERSTRTQITTDVCALENMLKQSTHNIELFLLSHFVVEQTIKLISLHKQLTGMG